LNQSLHDISIYYLLWKALESRVGLGVNQIELLQHVIYSKHVNWLKVWNFHLSQIIFGRMQQQNIPQVPLSSGAVACGEAMKNGRKIIASTQATGAEAFN
jgi:hypothetical protein